MTADYEPYLHRWTAAGLIDPVIAGRIRSWETDQSPPARLRWPVLLAVAFGAIMLSAGVLLFVSAHWDEISPMQRLSVVLLMVAAFHAAGAAVAGRFAHLSIALHGVGTIALGAGIAVTGQIFQLNEHWPAAVLLWAIGALIAAAVLRHWTQAALAAILIPWWLAAEACMNSYNWAPIFAGILALSFTYLSARDRASDSLFREALGWLGGLALLPAAVGAACEHSNSNTDPLAWVVAIALPIAVAAVLRRERAVWNVVATAWSALLVVIASSGTDRVAVYGWCALGAIALAVWGVFESRADRINLGVAGFAMTLLAFYFSSVMDKLGRSASLITLGLMFLGGGWLLERTRRTLVSQIRPEAAQ